MNLNAVISSLHKGGWYWGKVSYDTAIDKLLDSKSGTFLLRDSSDDHHLFTFAIKCHGDVINLRVHFSKGRFSLDSIDYCYAPSPTFDSVCDLAEYYMCKNKRFYIHIPDSDAQPLAVELKHPYLKHVLPLQHTCRKIIHRYLRKIEDVDKLPIPPKIHQFLRMYKYSYA